MSVTINICSLNKLGSDAPKSNNICYCEISTEVKQNYLVHKSLFLSSYTFFSDVSVLS